MPSVGPGWTTPVTTGHVRHASQVHLDPWPKSNAAMNRMLRSAANGGAKLRAEGEGRG